MGGLDIHGQAAVKITWHYGHVFGIATLGHFNSGMTIADDQVLELLLSCGKAHLPVPTISGDHKNPHLHAQFGKGISNLGLHFRCTVHHAIVFN